MLKILDIDHVVLRALDPERLERFYCDVLGCSVDRRQDAFGLVHLRAGRALIDIVGVDGPLGARGGAAPGREGHNVDHVCLRIEPFDADAIRAHLDAHGVRVEEEGPRYGAEGTGFSFYVSDPEGNVVELKGPSEPTGSGSA